MIISKIRLYPFGGMYTEKALEFKDGLNVVLGPNESGKSTLFNAIEKALFIPVYLNKREFHKHIERFIPLGGGDTVQVELTVRHNGESFTIKRIWGPSPSSELILPNGSLIKDENKISDALEELLPVKEGTFRSVLMTYQSGLSKTLKDLNDEYYDTVQSLGDILRKALQESDGVSVERFKNLIEKKNTAYFSSWDIEHRTPRNNRGINDPYIRNVGLILQAYYDKEKIRVALEGAKICEEELDELNKKIGEVKDQIAQKEQFLSDNKKAMKDAQERRVVEAQLESVLGNIRECRKDYDLWTAYENNVKAINKELPNVKGKKEELLQDQKAAREEAKRQDFRERFERLSGIKEKLTKAEEDIKKVKKITKEDMERIRTVYGEREKLITALTAGKLSVRLTAKRELNLSIKQDLKEEKKIILIKAEPIEFEAGGRIEVEIEDLTFEATSGKANYGEIFENYKQTEKNFNALLTKFDVKSFEEAEKANSEYEDSEGEGVRLRTNFEEELGENSYEQLESQYEDMGPALETRSLEDIAACLMFVDLDLEKKEKDLKEAQEEIENYQQTYDSKEKLFTKVAEMVGEQKKIEEQINGFAPLPEGEEDNEKFIEKYQFIEEEVKDLREELHELKIQQTQLIGNLPDQSVEELETQQGEAEELFARKLNEGEAVARILSLSNELLEQTDTETYRGLADSLCSYASIMTDNRYKQVEMDELLPAGLIRQDGNVLGCELLSTGTQDVLFLALRLAMAERFLSGLKGFLIMDDPLVDLDPERQRKAIDVIQEFATHHQVLFFTCHPSHAELLGGKKIELARL